MTEVILIVTPYRSSTKKIVSLFQCTDSSSILECSMGGIEFEWCRQDMRMFRRLSDKPLLQ